MKDIDNDNPTINGTVFMSTDVQFEGQPKKKVPTTNNQLTRYVILSWV